MNTEVNGPANIIMLLDYMLEAGKIDARCYRELKENAERTVKYIHLLSNPTDVKWYDVK